MLRAFVDRLMDRRAFAGALALLLVGLQLSVMMAFYFMPGGQAFALLQTRWWWELAFNLQILCFVLMWLAHSERIALASGWRKARAISRLIVGLGGVSTPLWTLIICASNNWFRDKPDLGDLAFYAALIFIVWVGAAYVLPTLIRFFLRKPGFIYLSLGDGSTRLALLNLSPFLLLALVSAEEIWRGGELHIVIWPFLTYLHGAMPYLYRAFAPGTDAAAAKQGLSPF